MVDTLFYCTCGLWALWWAWYSDRSSGTIYDDWFSVRGRAGLCGMIRPSDGASEELLPEDLSKMQPLVWFLVAIFLWPETVL